jgi:hypothetical protein
VACLRSKVYEQLQALRDRYADEIRRRYPNLEKVPRRVSGYNLDDLLPERGFHVARALSGTEGTCVTVLEAQLHLVPSPRARSVLVLGYPDVYSAADHIGEVLESRPVGLEGIDDVLVHDMKKKNIRCREQIAGLTGRGALHLAQVIQMAMHEGPEGPTSRLPERDYEPLGQ